MSDDKPTTETVEPGAQVAPAAESVQPATEEVFDKERAMNTILKLREIEKKAKQDAKELEALKAEKAKREEAELSELDRLKKQAAELAEQKARLEADIIRRDVIAETGLPVIFADRLKGDTKEAMIEDAKEILKAVPSAKQAPKVGATNPANAQSTETDAQRRARLFGAQGNAFDFEAVKQKGGGVIINK